MKMITINGAEYEGEVLPLSEKRIVIRFGGAVPVKPAAEKISVMEDGTVTKVYEGFTTVYQISGLDVILANDGSTCVTDDSEDIETLRTAKLQEIAMACKDVIYAGIEVNGEKYSLTENDQTNLFQKNAQIAAGATQIEYHSDGNLCRFYSAEEMTAIIAAAVKHITYNTTYVNSLNSWIRSAETAEEIRAIYYGAEIPEAYQSEVLQALVTA